VTRAFFFLPAVVLLGACGPDGGDPPGPDGGVNPGWRLIHHDLPGALLSVWGTSAADVWIAGADARDGSGPLVLHYDGAVWERVPTGQTQGDLWWVFGFAGGPIYMGGAGGVILRYENGAFAATTTPSTDTVFGIWGASPDNLWAVGGAPDTKSGFAWRLAGDTWMPEPSLPSSIATTGAIWKIFGTSASDAWLVGSNGVSLHWDGASLSQSDTGVGSSLFTVNGNAQRYAAVGGFGTGIIIENDGSGWSVVTPDPPPYGMTGVVLAADQAGYAVGEYGATYRRDASGWHAEDLGFELQLNLHSVWIDPSGGVWAAGGQTGSFPLVEGLVIHKGDPVAEGGI
jgi:hypothetical protein